jgi:hypothetical protein
VCENQTRLPISPSETWGLTEHVTSKQIDSAFIQMNYQPLDLRIDQVGPQAHTVNFVVLARVGDDTTDVFTDDRLDKSAPFAVVVGKRRIEVPLSDGSRQRLNKTPVVDLYLAILPTDFRPAQAVSLSALNQLHGKVVGHTAVARPQPCVAALK